MKSNNNTVQDPSDDQPFYYAKDLTAGDTIKAGEEFLIVSTISDPAFLQDAKSKGYKGLVNVKLENDSKETVTLNQIDSWIGQDTGYHKVTVEPVNESESFTPFTYTVSLYFDVDDRGSRSEVDTIFPYRESKIIMP